MHTDLHDGERLPDRDWLAHVRLHERSLRPGLKVRVGSASDEFVNSVPEALDEFLR